MLYRPVGTHLWEEEKIEWDSTYRRIRGTGYVVDLAVQAFLFQSLIETDHLSSYGDEEVMEEERNELDGDETPFVQ